MGLDPAEAQALFGSARVARLATVRPDGSPHVVPVCFAVSGDTIYTAVDHKPKSTTELARLATSPPSRASRSSQTATTTTGRGCGGCAWTATRWWPIAAGAGRALAALAATYPSTR